MAAVGEKGGSFKFVLHVLQLIRFIGLCPLSLAVRLCSALLVRRRRGNGEPHSSSANQQRRQLCKKREANDAYEMLQLEYIRAADLIGLLWSGDDRSPIPAAAAAAAAFESDSSPWAQTPSFCPSLFPVSPHLLIMSSPSIGSDAAPSASASLPPSSARRVTSGAAAEDEQTLTANHRH